MSFNCCKVWMRALPVGVVVAALALMMGADEKVVVNWNSTDVRGAAVKVPSAQKPTVMLFVLPEQTQSQQAIAELKAATAQAVDVQIVAIVDGKDAGDNAKKLADALPWPVVADSEYAASGKLNVHAWPTTLVVGKDGQQVAHLPGVPKAYAKDLESYLAFAAGKIDADALKQRLESHDTVIDSAQQMADRHLRVAQRLMDKGLADQAKVELAAGLKLVPQHAGLQMAMIDVLLSVREPEEAMKLLDQIDAKAVNGPRSKLLKGRVLMAMGKWDEARTVLMQALALNPDPAEAWYELGRVYQQQQDWQKAAEAFRRAFEATTKGKNLSAETRPAPGTTAP